MLPACRVCGSARIQLLCRTKNDSSPTTPISHFRCRDCGSVFVGDVIDSAELGIAYSKLDTTQYYEDISTENRAKMAAAIASLGGLTRLSASIIDVGTGDGLFVELLHAAGFTDVSGHEITGANTSRIADIATRIYQDFDYGTIPSNNFEVATLLDVVEHVIDPSFLMATCHRILKPGGLIYFHTPVVTRTDRMMHALRRVPVLHKLGKMWQRGRTSVFHLENYTPGALRQLLERSGFQDIQIEVKNELSWPVTMYIRNHFLK